MSLLDLVGLALEDPEKLVFAYEAGHSVGEILNETLVQPYLDQHQAGAGEAGETYLHWINEHNFDPTHPLDSLHHEPDHTGNSHDHHDAPVHDDFTDHHTDYSSADDYCS